MFARHACVLQHDQSDCGAAALATVALHYKRPIGLQQMRDLAGTDRIGTNLAGVARAAEKLGFTARGVKGDFHGLLGVRLPAIAHWINDQGQGHFVVVHKVGAASALIADPARGVRTVPREEFQKRWTGCLLLLTPGPEPLSSPGPTGPWRRLTGLLRPHASALLEAFFCAVLLTGLGLGTSYFVRHLVDSVLVHGEWRLLNALAVGMLALALFRTLFGTVRQVLLAHVARKVNLDLVSRYARHVLGQPLAFFETRRAGEILSRVNDAAKVQQTVSGTVLGAAVDATLLVLCATVMFLYDWRLALVAAAFVPVFLLAIGAHHPATRRLSRRSMEDGALLQAHLIEDVSGVDAIKTSGQERRRADEGEEHLARMTASTFSLQMLGVSMSSLGMFLAAAAGVVVLWYGGHRSIDGALTIGELMFFYTLLGFMLQPLERLSTVTLQLQDALVAVDRLGEILDLAAEDLEERGRGDFTGLAREIRLEQVGFRYGCRRDVLRKIDLTVPAGRTVAIVGESGCGKTTLLRLLTRLYDPTEGRITFDGVDARDLTRASLRARIGIVPQDPCIFTGTVRENVAFGRPDATFDEIAAAVRAAGLEEFVNALPQRCDTVIGERGANLSGGQRQRLAIARALLGNPEILIFDEATSHLDTETERALRASLLDGLAGRTVILVAHRFSTVRDADLIYVMHEGRVVESGSHAELVERDGRYAALWRAQTEEPELPLIVLEDPIAA